MAPQTRVESKVRYALRLLRWWVKRPVPPVRSGTVRLHVGCGPIDIPGFINIDVHPYPHVHYLRDVRSEPLWDEGGVDLIYASHVLEHVPRPDVPRILRHWCQVLKEGGILRLSVPDYDALHAHYASHRDLDFIAPPLMGGQGYPYDFHYSVFNESTLEGLLKAAGFRSVRKWIPAVLGADFMQDWASFKITVAEQDRNISLNLEAIR